MGNERYSNDHHPGGKSETIDQLGISAVEIQDYVSAEFGPLFQYGTDFPGKLREELQKAALLTGDELYEVAAGVLERLEDSRKSGLVLTPADEEKMVRNRIGERMVGKMENYLSHVIEYGIGYDGYAVQEDAAKNFINAARALLTK